MSTPKIMNDILEMFEANWQMFATLFGALTIGYAVARRFEKLLGKDREGRSVVDRLERMEHQMYPNGGSSLADKLDYVRRDQNKMKQSIAEISGELKVIKDIVTVIVDK
jgi:hypothetical protein